MKDEASSVPLPLATGERADLEYPWTLTMEVRRTADTQGRGILLASGLAEICANYRRDEEVTIKAADGSTRKEKPERRGRGTRRAAGTLDGNGTPGESQVAADTGKSSGKMLPLNEWATLTIVGEQNRYTLWLNGEKIAESPNQLVRPLRHLGGGKFSKARASPAARWLASQPRKPVTCASN